MPFIYDRLWKLLIDNQMKKTDLISSVDITPTTLSKLSKNQNVSMLTLDKLCSFFSCNLEDIVEHQRYLPREKQQVGTFRPNHTQAIHRWFPYLEGYSKQFVEKELSEMKGIKSVLDPFAGSGTTMLVCSLAGITTYYAEINPVLSFVSNTKINTVINITKENKQDLLLDVIHDVLIKLKASPTNIIEDFGGFEKYYTQENLSAIISYKKIINDINDADIHNILMLALLSIAVDTSKMIRRGDLRYAKGEEINKTNKNFYDSIRQKLFDMYDDIKSVHNVHMSPTIKLADDVREINQSDLVDAVITSPPYLNGTNYSRNTKLELKLLDCINNENDLSFFHSKGIVAGINNVSAATTEGNILDEVLPYYDALVPVAYDKRIPTMVSEYFNDMQKAIKQLSKSIRKDGYLVIDIGDSQFAGIHIPTHDLLTKIAIKMGFVPTSETIIRKRTSKDGSQLSQRILRFRRN